MRRLTNMLRKGRQEDGWVVVTAIVLLTIMMGVGLASYSYVDNQNRNSRVERERESAFNLAEGALNTVMYFISANGWPGNTPQPNCTQSGGGNCPSPSSVSSGFNQADFASGVTWSVEIHDNADSSANFYNDTTTRTQPSYDQGGPGAPTTPDKKVWMRAEAVVRGQKRVIVALVKQEPITENFPRNTITAGYVDISQNGKQVYIDQTAPGGQVAVRCQATDTNCVSDDPSKGQISPRTIVYGWSSDSALTDDALDRLAGTAQANGTYCGTTAANSSPGFCDPTTLCPLASKLDAAKIVFVDKSGNCKYTSNGSYHTAQNPGVFILRRATLEFYEDWHGLLYAANRDNITGIVINTKGNGHVYGGISVDGPGGVAVGNSKGNLVFDPNVFPSLQSYGNAGIIQNTWRELPLN